MPQTIARPPPPPPFQTPNIWTQMSYHPPLGPCALKPTLLSTTCPCHRFMQHPLQAASSYVCDGCGHHASFHALESAEEAVLRRWRREREEEAEIEEGGEEERGVDGGREGRMIGEGRGEMVVVVGGKGTEGGVVKRRGMIGGVGGAGGSGEGEDGEVVPVASGRKRRRMIGGEGGNVVEIVDGEDEEVVPVASGRKRKGRW